MMAKEELVTKDMTIGEVVAKYPNAVPILQKHGFQCMGCAANPYESIEQGIVSHGFDEKILPQLMRDLNAAAKNAPKVALTDKPVELTDMAAKEIRELMEQEKKSGYGLKISVVKGGCAGYSYEMEFADKPADGEEALETHGLKVYYPKEHLSVLQGTVIDFKKSLQGGGFVMRNPNAKTGCGCGSSFGV